VQVCPTGIDIRQGLQYECIGCGACADVCNGVMDKMGYSKGLVRYTTQNALDNHWDSTAMLKRVFRPRVLIYTAIVWILIIALGVSLWLRTPMKVDVLRDRGSLARITSDGYLDNVFRLQIMNATEGKQHMHIQVRGAPGLAINEGSHVEVLPAQSRWAVVDVSLPPDALAAGSHKIWFDLSNEDGSLRITEASVFVVPK
jgi:polyferredoxin